MTTSYIPPDHKAVGRKIGTIKAATDELAYQRVVYLPLDIAIIYAAVQNFRIDLAKGVHPRIDVWDSVQVNYFEEAAYWLKEDGYNHFPGDNGEPWIHYRNYGKLAVPSERSVELKRIFDMIFERNDESLFDSELYPDLTKHRSAKEIEDQRSKVYQRLSLH